jgi:hypothetical protein
MVFLNSLCRLFSAPTPAFYPCSQSIIDLRFRLPHGSLPELKVLNVGAGTGDSGLARQLPFLNFKQLDYLDVHKPYLDAAKTKVYDAESVNFILGDIRGFDTSPYDLVMMFDVLEHLPKEDSIKVLNDIKCTKLVFIPLEKEFRENKFGAESQDHLSFWTEQDFKDLGFETEVLFAFHRDEKNVWDALWALKY